MLQWASLYILFRPISDYFIAISTLLGQLEYKAPDVYCQNKTLVSVNALSWVLKDEQFLRLHFLFCKMETVVELGSVFFMQNVLCTWVVKSLAWYLMPALLPLYSLLLSLIALWVKPHCNYMFLKSLENFTPVHAYLKPRINAATNPSPDFLFRIFHLLEPLNPSLSLSQWQGSFQPSPLGRQLWEREIGLL